MLRQAAARGAGLWRRGAVKVTRAASEYAAAPPPPPRSPARSGATFGTEYGVFKGKGCLKAGVIPPTWVPAGGNYEGATKLGRSGVVLLEFAPATAPREYNWSQKQTFALSAHELGELLLVPSTGQAQLTHQPALAPGFSGSAETLKLLQVSPTPDGAGYFFRMETRNGPQGEGAKLTVPVTNAEFVVLCNLFSYAIPVLLGWDVALGQRAPAR